VEASVVHLTLTSYEYENGVEFNRIGDRKWDYVEYPLDEDGLLIIDGETHTTINSLASAIEDYVASYQAIVAASVVGPSPKDFAAWLAPLLDADQCQFEVNRDVFELEV